MCRESTRNWATLGPWHWVLIITLDLLPPCALCQCWARAEPNLKLEDKGAHWWNPYWSPCWDTEQGREGVESRFRVDWGLSISGSWPGENSVWLVRRGSLLIPGAMGKVRLASDKWTESVHVHILTCMHIFAQQTSRWVTTNTEKGFLAGKNAFLFLSHVEHKYTSLSRLGCTVDMRTNVFLLYLI